MFADTLMQFERACLERLVLWGATSVVVGTAVLALLALRRARSPLLTHFAVQAIVWGAACACFGLFDLRAVPMRDLAGATQLDRLVWFASGLDVGVIAVGMVLAAVALRSGQRPGLLGAGIGVVVQGAALLAIHGRLLGEIRL